MKKTPAVSKMPSIAEDDGAENPKSPKMEVYGDLSCESSESSGPMSTMESDLRNVIEMMGQVSELDQTGKEADTSELVGSNAPEETLSMLSSAAELTMEEDSCTIKMPKPEATCPCSQEKKKKEKIVCVDNPIASPENERRRSCHCHQEKNQVDIPREKQVTTHGDQDNKMQGPTCKAPDFSDKPASVYVCGGVHSFHALPVPRVPVPFPAASYCPVHGTDIQYNQDMYQRMQEQHMAQSPCKTQPCNKKCGIPTRIYRRIRAIQKKIKKGYTQGKVCSTQNGGHLDYVHKRSKPCKGDLQFKEPGIPIIQQTPCPPCQIPYEGVVMGSCDEPLCGGPRERVDIYYFDHGNSGYYRTTDRPPLTKADLVLEDVDEKAIKFWVTVFGYLHIPFSFVIQFVLQIIRFLLCSIVRPLTVGVIQLVSDYLTKPLLSIVFNGIIQPVLILAYNISTSIRDLCRPYAQAVGYFLKELSIVVRALRLVDVYNVQGQGCKC